MKRDMNLIREILLFAEKMESDWSPERFGSNANWTIVQIKYHIGLCEDRGLLRVNYPFTDRSHIEGLTWEGHEFLAKIRDDKTWHTITVATELVRMEPCDWLIDEVVSKKIELLAEPKIQNLAPLSRA